MKPHSLAPLSEEIELKLALPTSDPSSLAKRLAQTPVLARRPASRQQLHNIYFDTPEQQLRQQRVALRLRRIGSEVQPQWLQTLKTGGRDDSALSQRGEWETPVPNDKLSLKALKATPWSTIDPDGKVFRALSPCFVTAFERTSWMVRRRDGSVVEVALDVGQIVAGDKTTPVCELELELKAGPSAALFDIAEQIARTIAVLPSTMSKAQRGFALAQGTLDLPLHAQSQALASDLPLPATVQCVLREMFNQFTSNLNALCSSDEPEVVHQARVGWRRFKSAMRFFKPALASEAVPSWQALQTLWMCLGELRDLDVARTETLPLLADAYMAGDDRRAQAWQAMTQALAQAAELQRKAVRYALQAPAVGACLLATTQWLESLPALNGTGEAAAKPKISLRRWTKGRILHLHRQLRRALKDAESPDHLHRVRILAKRIRYDIDALRPLLPKRLTQREYRRAANLQATLGASRDVMQAAVLVAKLEVDRGLIEFLRGVAAGQGRQS